jgi:uncharacterized membrane protein
MSHKGFIVLISTIALVSFAAGMVFLALGAWPVLGFFGLDVFLVWWALSRNFSDARVAESICISDSEVVWTRNIHGQQQQLQRFQRPWVRVVLEQDFQRELIGRLLLTSRGSKAEIGSFMAPNDRKSLARKLNEILA